MGRLSRCPAQSKPALSSELGQSIMRTFKSARLTLFTALIALGAVFYLVDCSIVSLSKTHPELPWLYRGVYAGGPFGILVTATVVMIGLGALIFGGKSD
jgi:hypothetical protein